MRPRQAKISSKSVSTDDIDLDSEDQFDASLACESADEPYDSDVSEYGKKVPSGQDKLKKKRQYKTKKTNGLKKVCVPEPAKLPDISDDDMPLDDLFDSHKKSRLRVKGTGERKPTLLAQPQKDSPSLAPSILQLNIDSSSSRIINLDVGRLLHKKRKLDDADISSLTLVGEDDIYESSAFLESQEPPFDSTRPMSKRQQRLEEAKAKKSMAAKKTGFTSLPEDLREDIYRRAFVGEDAIDFTSRAGFPRSAALLRTCRLVHDEGRRILYGENAFHFRRCSSLRGNYSTEHWVEIGFKDIRRFLQDIGPTNISFFQYVSFDLCDASPSGTPHSSDDERRFVNDPVLHHIFELIGTHAHLLKFAFDCNPRKSVSKVDYHFLRSIGTIRAQEVIYTMDHWASAAKVPPTVVERLKETMILAKDDEDKIDQNKKRRPTVKMHHEQKKRPRYYRGW
ncbi:MAG: hypothetical protein Q9160_007379 [Pyrenula sp. 1 TL-2023]